MRILIADDEPLARARLRRLVDDLDAGSVVAEASDGAEALALTESCRPDLLLLDIRMPRMDGLEVARHLTKLSEPPAVVFTTAYDAHALAAIEACAVAYLLKPIRKNRLEVALERARTLTRAQRVALDDATVETNQVRFNLSATLNGRLRLLPIAEVRYFRAEHKYVTARHPDGELVIDDPLGTLEREFRERFMRVHRNALVALEHVSGLSRGTDGQLCIEFHGIVDRVPISRRLAATVRKALKRRPPNSHISYPGGS